MSYQGVENAGVMNKSPLTASPAPTPTPTTISTQSNADVSVSLKIKIPPTRKVRSDAKLYELSDAQRQCVVTWLKECGVADCCAYIEGELGIKVSRAAVYRALAYWRREERFCALAGAAQGQLDLEAEFAEEDGLSIEELHDAVDRSCIARALDIAEETGDFTLYLELRRLSIATLKARTQAKLAELKIRSEEARLKQQQQQPSRQIASPSTNPPPQGRGPQMSDAEFEAKNGMNRPEMAATMRKEHFPDIDAVKAA